MLQLIGVLSLHTKRLQQRRHKQRQQPPPSAAVSALGLLAFAAQQDSDASDAETAGSEGEAPTPKVEEAATRVELSSPAVNAVKVC